jgi:3-oxoacyl-[acyl-carrier protein] reductase
MVAPGKEGQGMVSGKAALVTGASRGIGYGIAAELVRCGAKVCLTARKQDELDTALGELDAGEHAFAVAGGSDDADHRSDAVQQTIDRFGSLDLLVNNAGTNPYFGPLVDADLGAVDKIMRVNAEAPIGWVQQAWHAWMGEHGGAICNVASLGGIQPGPLIGPYNASKAALLAVTRQYAAELAPTVRVNAIAPAVVKTQFARALYESDEEGAASVYPLKRLGTIEDTAKAVRFLLSDEASWITGETLTLDGGIGLVGFGGAG